MGQIPIRILLIEDQESDYLLTRKMLASCETQAFDLQWANSWQAGIEAIRRCAHDICLLDFRIGGGDGLELLKESRSIGCNAPIILLTGISDRKLDLEAMEYGAADFLLKDKLTPDLLERSIRYAIAQAHAMDELRRNRDELRASELRFRAVVQSAGDAIIISDESANVRFWNSGAESIFGYTEEEIVGHPIEILMPEQYRARHRAGFERFRSTGRSQIIGHTVELEGLRKDGSIFPLELSLAAWTNGNGTMFTAIIRDISERKRTEELLGAKEAAEDASREKSAFVARMSHELRTPLHAILGFTNLLLEKNESLTGKATDFLQRIQLNAKHQLELINSILDISKVEAGRMDLQLQSVSVDCIMRDVVKQLEPEHRNPNVQVRVVVPSTAKPLMTDPQKLKQVLINIIENALKFTEQGTVNIELIVDQTNMKPVRIDITDTGIGMPRDRINEIFEPFRQLESDVSEKPVGTGLGLSISRSLCELMGYQLKVQSEQGRGSRFSILLEEQEWLPLSA
jgi:protein-histidine pros-kinase